MEKQQYHTIQHDAETEIVIQKSRFICRAKQVKTEEEATTFLQQIQKKHWDATHNCFAYQITDMIQKASDDGEPSGTAGRPILNVIQKNELLYTIVIITRYFGGIKLGGGGLIRAYSQGAAEVIQRAGIAKMVLHQQLLLTFDFTHLSKMEHELRRTSCYMEPMQFTEEVTCPVWVPMEQKVPFLANVEAWTNGQVKVQVGETAYKPHH